MSSSAPHSFALSLVLGSLVLGLGGSLGLAGCDDKPTPPQATVAPATSTNSATAPAPTADTVTYSIDPATSKVEWTGAKITAHHDGNFTSFKGTITVPGGKAETAKIHLDVDTPSLTTQPDKLAGHLKSPDFFDVEKFPKATFDSSTIAAGGANGATHTITGNLTLHGVTKSVTFPATVTVSKDKVSAKAEFSIMRKDWNLVYPGMPNDLIKDDVAIHLTIEAPKQGS
jgi:polyisoprenoid-binding protein YceI